MPWWGWALIGYGATTIIVGGLGWALCVAGARDDELMERVIEHLRQKEEANGT